MSYDAWIDPINKTIYKTGNIEHAHFVLMNPKKFDVSEHTVKKYVFEPSKINQLVISKGWARVKLSDISNELNIQAKNLRIAHRAARLIFDKFPDRADTLRIDIIEEPDDFDLYFFVPEADNDYKLAGNRLDFFLRKGKVPTAMVAESELEEYFDSLNFWYDSNQNKIFEFESYEHADWIEDHLKIRNPFVYDPPKSIRYAINHGFVRVARLESTGQAEWSFQGKDLQSVRKAIREFIKKRYFDIDSGNVLIVIEATTRFNQNNYEYRGKNSVILSTVEQIRNFVNKGWLPTKTSKMREAVFTFGRFNPPTVGHKKLINAVIEMANQKGIDHFIFPSKSVDKFRNPLVFEDKMRFMKKAFNEANICELDIATPFTAIDWLKEQGYNKITMVVGSDRLDEFKSSIPKYHEDITINFESAGERGTGDLVSDISSSKVRDYVLTNNYSKFKESIPLDEENDIQELYNLIKDNMKLSESEQIRYWMERCE